jgi:hypothetical protein
MAIVHFVGAFLAGLAFPVIMTGLDPQWVMIGIISGFFVALIGGGLTFGLARLGHHLAIRGGRGWGRETLGVGIGAVAGGTLLGLVLIAAVGVYGLAIVAIAGIGSAIGLGIWILVAWAPFLQSRPVPLN